MMAENKQRYVVAKGCSFVGNKKSYKEGDEINETAFSKPEHFKKMLGGKNPRIIPAPAKEKNDTSEADKAAAAKIAADEAAVKKIADEKAAADKIEADKAAAEKRAEHEKLAIEKGLIKKEALKDTSDEQLEKILKDAGLIK